MKTWSWLSAILLFSLAASIPCDAQPRTGMPPLNSFGGEPDVLNLGNLNAHWDIPIINKAGRGTNFTYDLTYDSSIWSPVTSGSSTSWQPVAGYGWGGLIQTSGTYIGYSMTTSQGGCGQYGQYHWQSWTYNNFLYRDQYGTTHPLDGSVTYISSPGSQNQCPPGGTSPSLPYTFPAADDSGFTVTVSSAGQGSISMNVTSASGTVINAPVITNPNGSQGAYTDTDRNGNEISYNGSGQFTDTLGTTPLSISGAPPNNTTLNFTNPSGGTSSYTVSYTSYNIKTNFGCSGISEYSASGVYLVNKVTLPDGRYYQFSYEATPGYSGYYTGRVASVTLPTGGTISYSYSGGSNGIVCADGSAAGMTRTTPDGTWTYARSGSGEQWTTTITAPTYQGSQNQTVIAFVADTIGFANFYEISRKIYSGSASSGTLLRTVLHCYNSSTYCSSSTGDTQSIIGDPITWRQTTIQMGGSTAKASGRAETYNSYGLVTQRIDYGFGTGGAFGSAMRQTLTSYASLANGVNDMPSQVTIENGSGTVYSETQYAYDQSAVTTTSGTPQHVSGTNAGNLTTLTQCIASGCSGSTALTSTFTYFDTGNVKVATDVNGAQTNYTYGGCGNSFLTQISYPVNSLTTNATWNCTGGVQLTSVDPNTNTTTYTYGDPNYWRVTKTTDPWGNATTQSYPTGTGSSNASESVLTFNSGNSATDVLTQYDNQGRVELSERRQAPSSSTFDISEVTYDALGRSYQTSLPYSGSAGTLNPTPGSATTYDPLGRVILISDSGGGSTSYSWDPQSAGNQNDVLATLGPAPSGENTKRRQFEYDALGRLASVCEVTSLTGSGTCAQASNKTGYWTEYTYDPAGRLTEVQQNAQSSSVQIRTVSYDWLGRKTQETIPETGTTYYTYDTDSTCGTSHGDLVKIIDAVGNTTCITYDGMHRPLTTTVSSGSYASVTQQVHYVYDAATVNSTTMQNVKGTLAEAWTCTGSCSSKATDMGFSYFPESGSTGRLVAQVYEMTPHSSPHYYLTQDIDYPNGTVGNITASLNGSSISVPGVNFGLDGEGRLYSATDTTNSLTLTSSASYNAASSPTGITLGNSDSDAFQYDSNTFRPTQFKYSITGSGAFTITGNLTWNANWSLQQMAVTDTNDSSKNQTCTYSADDLQRIASVNCSSAWAQTFSYDAFGNIAKSGSSSYAAGYSYLTNRVSSGVTASYDANGNQTQNTWASFAWNALGQPVTVNGISATYDALGRMVETVNGSTYTEYIYRPSGDKLAILNGSTLLKGTIPLPGGATAVYNSSGVNYFRHKDWLGSSRLATTWSHGIYSKEAYAPFGEPYFEAGTQDRSFTGEDQDTTTGIYDFMFRRYDSAAGRWLSPDPAGWGAVDLSTPQSMDRYAYVQNNPLRFTDALGLDDNCTSGDDNGQDDADSPCASSSEGYGGDSASSGNCDQVDQYGNCYQQNGDGSISPNDPTTVAVNGDDPPPPPCAADPNCWTNYYYVNQASQISYLPPSPVNFGPSYSPATVCAADALLHKGLDTALDAVGLIPGEGTAVKIAQTTAGVISAGISASGNGGLAEAGTSATGLSLTVVVDDAKVLTIPKLVKGASILGKFFGITSLLMDVSEMHSDYQRCMAGKD